MALKPTVDIKRCEKEFSNHHRDLNLKTSVNAQHASMPELTLAKVVLVDPQTNVDGKFLLWITRFFIFIRFYFFFKIKSDAEVHTLLAVTARY